MKTIIEQLTDLGLTRSRSEARRMVRQKAVFVNGQVTDNEEYKPLPGMLLRVGESRSGCVPTDSQAERCPPCDGEGTTGFSQEGENECPACDGTGFVFEDTPLSALTQVGGREDEPVDLFTPVLPGSMIFGREVLAVVPGWAGVPQKGNPDTDQEFPQVYFTEQEDMDRVTVIVVKGVGE